MAFAAEQTPFTFGADPVKMKDPGVFLTFSFISDGMMHGS